MPSHRRIALLVVVAASVLAPAATAGAARTERFVAFFRIQQRTTWAEPTTDTTVGCDRVYSERHGTESSTLRTKPARARFTRLPGGSVAIAFGPLHRPVLGLEGRGRAERAYVSKSFRTYGPCTPRPGFTVGREDDVDGSCDAGFRSRVQFVGIGRRFEPIVRVTNPLELGVLLPCDVEHADTVNWPVTSIAGNLPPGRIFGEEEYVILKARERFRRAFQTGGSTTTHVSWTLRMRRAR